MKIKFILPALEEAQSPFWRPIKYSLFPPLGLATLAGFLPDDAEASLIDQHVQRLSFEDLPDIAVIQVYVTNAYRAYDIADYFRQQGVFVVLGGLHVTALPQEAIEHADTIICGPAEEAFPRLLQDYRNGRATKIYSSETRSLAGLPPARRDLFDRRRYLVPNSLVIGMGCPHTCDFCYKESFFKGGKSYYSRTVDDVLAEIESLSGRHLFFLDDHLLADTRLSRELFTEMRGMGRVFQGAATVASILESDTLEVAVEAGLRSLFVGFESLEEANLSGSGKNHNIGRDYRRAIDRLHDLGVMINGSFVFGMDADDKEVFSKTVNWAVEMGLATSTFHIATPYPGTEFYRKMKAANRIITQDWNRYDTRSVTFQPALLSVDELQQGYEKAYRDFYRWQAIVRACLGHDTMERRLRQFLYTAGWKKAEPFWNMVIQLRKLNVMTPMLESILSFES